MQTWLSRWRLPFVTCFGVLFLSSIGCTTAPVNDSKQMSMQPTLVPKGPSVRASGGAMAMRGALSDYGPLPRELEMVTMPEYMIEPPDILRISALRVIPLSPYRVEPLDILFLEVSNVFNTSPIAGAYAVDPDGTLNLGDDYGTPVRVSGMTLPQVKEAIELHLKRNVKIQEPIAKVSLGQSKALQQIGGEHLVRMDGSIGLGTYGSVRVVGMTLTQAKAAIETHLSRFLQTPEISIEIAAYNTKTFFVIFDGAGRGQQVVQLPITGRDTVLNAISQVFGLSPVSSKNRIFVARPAPAHSGQEPILPVDWRGITERGETLTNYQLFPGDRLFVRANRLVTVDNFIAQVLSPFERMFGFTLLGNATIRAVQGEQNGIGGGF